MVNLSFNSDHGRSIKFSIIEHFTLIIGIDSGEGKTWCFEYLQEHLEDNEEEVINIESDLPVRFCNTFFDLQKNLDLEDRTVLLIDEIAFTKSSIIMKKLNSAKHCIVCISRSFPCGYNCSIDSIYRVLFKDDWFVKESAREFSNIWFKRKGAFVKSDHIIVESARDKSEHLFFSTWIKDKHFIPADGRENIVKEIDKCNKDDDILVIMDLANFASQFSLLNDRSSKFRKLYFYDYLSFEEMIFDSDFIQGSSTYDPFDYLTLEKYYENVIHEFTLGKPWYCSHNHVSDCCLKECSKCCTEKSCDNKFKSITGDFLPNKSISGFLYEVFLCLL